MKESEDTVTKQGYNEVASRYADYVFEKQHMRRLIADFCSSLQPGARILELGCGPGNDSSLFIAQGMKVVGVDFAEEMIKEAQKRVPGAKFICADIREIDFSDKFDAVWCVGTLHHLRKEDVGRVLGKVDQWLKPGGKFFISVKSGMGEGFEVKKKAMGVTVRLFWSYWRKPQLARALEEAGLKVNRIEEAESERKRDLPEVQKAERWINVWGVKEATSKVSQPVQTIE